MQEVQCNDTALPAKSIWDEAEFPAKTRPINITPTGLLEMLDKYANYESDIENLCSTYHINTHTFFGLCRLYPEIEQVYRVAQRERAEHMAHESISIADDDSNDLMMQTSAKGQTWFTPNMANVRRADLRVRSRQYLMERYNPDIYAQRTKIEQTSRSVNLNINTTLPSVADLETVGLEGLQDIQRDMRYGESASDKSGATRR